jgi:hypothetical protein
VWRPSEGREGSHEPTSPGHLHVATAMCRHSGTCALKEIRSVRQRPRWRHLWTHVRLLAPEIAGREAQGFGPQALTLRRSVTRLRPNTQTSAALYPSAEFAVIQPAQRPDTQLRSLIAFRLMTTNAEAPRHSRRMCASRNLSQHHDRLQQHTVHQAIGWGHAPTYLR